MEWPYIVPLPVDKDKRVELLKEVFGSDVSLKILKTCLREGEVEQRFLIEKLNHSNKTILRHLARLTQLNILRESIKKRKRRGVKVYSLTEVGKWLATLLATDEIKGSERDLLRVLFRIYMTPTLRRFLKSRVNLKDELDRLAGDVLTCFTLESTGFKPEVVVLAPVCVGFFMELDEGFDCVGLAKNFIAEPTGQGVNLSIALSRLKIRTSLLSKVGWDKRTN